MTCSLSKNHKYFSTLKSTKEEKNEAADICSKFTKKIPIYFPEWNITRKMHLLGFVIPKIIRNDKSHNICYKFLKVEQAGERIHQKWNMLTQARFFSVRNGKEKLFLMFEEYENSLYIKK